MTKLNNIFLASILSSIVMLSSCSTSITSTTVTPTPAPVINSFIVDKLEIELGQSVLLSWSVSGESIVIDVIESHNSDVVADSGTSVSVMPDRLGLTSYTLTARNDNGSVFKVLQVNVIPVPAPTPMPLIIPAPVIDFFVVNDGSNSSRVTLEWSVQNAKNVHMEVAENGKVFHMGEHSLQNSRELGISSIGVRVYTITVIGFDDKTIIRQDAKVNTPAPIRAVTNHSGDYVSTKRSIDNTLNLIKNDTGYKANLDFLGTVISLDCSWAEGSAIPLICASKREPYTLVSANLNATIIDSHVIGSLFIHRLNESSKSYTVDFMKQ